MISFAWPLPDAYKIILVAKKSLMIYWFITEKVFYKVLFGNKLSED